MGHNLFDDFVVEVSPRHGHFVAHAYQEIRGIRSLVATAVGPSEARARRACEAKLATQLGVVRESRKERRERS